MPDVLNLHRVDIARGIDAVLPALGTLKTHSGRFGLAEVKRLANATPAVLVSVLRLTKQPSAIARWNATMALFVLTRDQLDLPRDESAISISEFLCHWLDGRQFVYGQAVTDIDAQNLYASELESLGLSLWGITFKSQLSVAQTPYSYGGNGIVDPLDQSLYKR